MPPMVYRNVEVCDTFKGCTQKDGEVSMSYHLPINLLTVHCFCRAGLKECRD